MRDFITDILDQLESWLHPEIDKLQFAEACRFGLRRIEARAVREGYPEIVNAVQVRSSVIGLRSMRLIVSRCLACCRSDGDNLKTSLLTVNDVASMLNISTRTVWRMRSAGEMPEVVNIGTSVRWRREDIEQIVRG